MTGQHRGSLLAWEWQGDTILAADNTAARPDDTAGEVVIAFTVQLRPCDQPEVNG